MTGGEEEVARHVTGSPAGNVIHAAQLWIFLPLCYLTRFNASTRGDFFFILREGI